MSLKLPRTQCTSVAWTGAGSRLIQGSINGLKHGVAIKATHLPLHSPVPRCCLLLAMAMS